MTETPVAPVIKRRFYPKRAGIPITKWSDDEVRKISQRAAELLLNKGYPADGWEPEARTHHMSDELHAIFIQAQWDTIPEGRMRGKDFVPGTIRRYPFRMIYKRCIIGVNKVIGKIARARENAKTHEGNITNNKLPPSPVPIPKPLAPAPIVPPEPAPIAPVAPVTSAFTDGLPIGNLIEVLLDRILSRFPRVGGTNVGGSQKIEVNISADQAERLMLLEKGQQGLLEEFVGLEKKFESLEARFTDLTARGSLGEASMTKPKVLRIAMLCRHREQFLRIESHIKAQSLPVEVRWVDVDKSPHAVFCDYALCTSEVSHKWTYKVKECIGPGRCIVGVTGPERALDIVKLWLSEITRT